MRPDPNYVRKLLRSFEQSPEPTTNIRVLRDRGIDYRETGFMFHLILMNDVGFVERADGESGIGVSRSANAVYSWAEVPLRLTAEGHEFARALESKEGFDAVENSSAKFSLRTMRDVAVKASQAHLVKHSFQS